MHKNIQSLSITGYGRYTTLGAYTILQKIPSYTDIHLRTAHIHQRLTTTCLILNSCGTITTSHSQNVTSQPDCKTHDRYFEPTTAYEGYQSLYSSVGMNLCASSANSTPETASAHPIIQSNCATRNVPHCAVRSSTLTPSFTSGPACTVRQLPCHSGPILLSLCSTFSLQSHWRQTPPRTLRLCRIRPLPESILYRYTLRSYHCSNTTATS